MTGLVSAPRDGSASFATLAVGAALALAVVALLMLLRTGTAADSVVPAGGGGGDAAASSAGAPVDLDDGAVADPNAAADEIVANAAVAMAEVSSVEFEVRREGADIFIDQFASIALDRVRGQFSVPVRAQAELTVTIDGNLSTRLGAIAIDDEVWLSNPVTGDFETLPEGFDIDPSRFFDPEGGWQPLLANLTDLRLIEVDDRGGQRWRVRGTAQADDVRNITVGLVRNQSIEADFWIHPSTSLVTAAEFDTVIGGQVSSWTVELDRFGDAFTIRPPENVRGGG